MEIRKIPVSKINPAAYNPRKNLQEGDPEYEKLKVSLREFGYIDPIIWNRRTGNLVGGHQRFKILVAEGATELDAVVVDFEETKEKAANIALNKISGDWDFGKLKELLVDLDAHNIDISITGFTSKDLEKMVTFDAPGEPDDRYPEMELQPFEHYDYIVLVFRNSMDFLKGCEMFKVEKKSFDGGGEKKKIGLCRVVDGSKVVNGAS